MRIISIIAAMGLAEQVGPVIQTLETKVTAELAFSFEVTQKLL